MRSPLYAYGEKTPQPLRQAALECCGKVMSGGFVSRLDSRMKLVQLHSRIPAWFLGTTAADIGQGLR